MLRALKRLYHRPANASNETAFADITIGRYAFLDGGSDAYEIIGKTPSHLTVEIRSAIGQTLQVDVARVNHERINSTGSREAFL